MKKSYISPNADFINVKMDQFIASGCTTYTEWELNALSLDSCHKWIKLVDTITNSQ